MGIPCDDIVLVQLGSTPTEPSVVTVNCPDKNGLGCDLCRIILEFGLFIVRGDATKVLTELEFTIQRVKVMTTPDGRVLDLFFITDGLELLHTKQRREETCEHMIAVLGEYSISCEIQLAGPEYESLQAFTSLPPAVAEELFGSELPDKEDFSRVLSTEVTQNKASITVDNLLSPAHTLLQIKCADQKGLFYDILRTSKDLNIQIAYGRISSSVKGYRNMDLFIRQTDGKKVVDPKQQTALCFHLKEEMLHPLRVMVTNRGPDTELLVANPVELCGKGRPRVFYDVTLALKALGICIFSAEIGRHSTSHRQWEVYRFLLDESLEFPLASSQARNRIVEKVKKTLMGCSTLPTKDVSDWWCAGNKSLTMHSMSRGHLARQWYNNPVCHLGAKELKMRHLACDCTKPRLPAHYARLCNNCLLLTAPTRRLEITAVNLVTLLVSA
ncbi:ACT domain-containing protein ACR9 [Citrus sinensis]|uniref:ACT domain-containing protein ACR9 n=1 Tax=Citrus sinensis TaxID=2711 RepID=A0ACB8L337_CITSI|nr:ACT domain-containing protein ACR9 [Citrus sinensis]